MRWNLHELLNQAYTLRGVSEDLQNYFFESLEAISDFSFLEISKLLAYKKQFTSINQKLFNFRNGVRSYKHVAKYYHSVSDELDIIEKNITMIMQKYKTISQDFGQILDLDAKKINTKPESSIRTLFAEINTCIAKLPASVKEIKNNFKVHRGV